MNTGKIGGKFERMNRRMGLIAFPADTGIRSDLQNLLCEAAPRRAGHLLLYEIGQSEILRESIGLRAGITDEALRVELLRHPHRLLGVDFEHSRGQLLHLDRVHRQWTPFAFWLFRETRDGGLGPFPAHVEDDAAAELVEETHALPVKFHAALFRLFEFVDHFDFPERFFDESLNLQGRTGKKREKREERGRKRKKTEENGRKAKKTEGNGRKGEKTEENGRKAKKTEENGRKGKKTEENGENGRKRKKTEESHVFV